MQAGENDTLLSIESDPYWLWCASGKRSPALLPEFSDANVIVEIDMAAFAPRLIEAGRKVLAPHAHVKNMASGWVDYERHKDFLYFGECKVSISHPSLLKNRDEYEHQQEYRLVWLLSKEVGGKGRREVNMGSNEHCARIVYP